jgi:hypothetical protein
VFGDGALEEANWAGSFVGEEGRLGGGEVVGYYFFDGIFDVFDGVPVGVVAGCEG